MQVFVTLFQEAFNSTTLPGRGVMAFAAFLHTHLQDTVIRELRLESRKKTTYTHKTVLEPIL